MKQQNPFTFYLQFNQITGSMDLCIIEESYQWRRIMKPVDMVFEVMKEWENYEPTFRFPNNMSKYFMEAMGEFVKNNWLDKKTESRMVGELEAQSKHLEDMRKLVFKK